MWGWDSKGFVRASVYDIMTQRVPLYPRVIITKGTMTTKTGAELASVVLNITRVSG